MAQHFDPTVIEQYANTLYKQADSTIIANTLMGLVFGGSVGLTVGSVFGEGAMTITVPVIAALGAWLGYNIGTRIGFGLKLQAQSALCQVRIEANTRPLTKQVNNTISLSPFNSSDADDLLQPLKH